MTKQEIVKVVMDQVEVYNANLDTPVDLKDGEATILFGGGGVLQSVDFVSLVLDIEEAIEDACGTAITLADEKALSQKNSPFRTVGTLSEYIAVLLEE